MKYFKPVRKTINKGNRAVFMETHESLILDAETYRTNGEELIIVKNVDYSTITLDSYRNQKITIKSLTNCLIIPDQNKIDDEWDEINLSKGSCVTFQFVEDSWYILASDGIKME